MAPLEVTYFISTHGFLVGNRTSSLPSINTILSMGRSNSRFEFSLANRSPMRSSTLRTNPFLSLLTSIVLAVDQWFLETLVLYTTTISPILKFVLLPSHFWFSCKGFTYSLAKLIGNVLDTLPTFSVIYLRLGKFSWWW